MFVHAEVPWHTFLYNGLKFTHIGGKLVMLYLYTLLHKIANVSETDFPF